MNSYCTDRPVFLPTVGMLHSHFIGRTLYIFALYFVFFSNFSSTIKQNHQVKVSYPGRVRAAAAAGAEPSPPSRCGPPPSQS